MDRLYNYDADLARYDDEAHHFDKFSKTLKN